MSTSLDREENVVLHTVYTISIIIGIVVYLTEVESYKSVNLNYNKEKEEEEEEEELCVILPYKTTYYTYLVRVFTTNYFYYCTKVLTRAFFSLVSTLSAI